jgi:DNA (cytosine-5)-methyltransferase 1
MARRVVRYYVLTTLDRCEPDDRAMAIFANVKAMYGCQVIANGVLPTLRYYLRLLDDPSSIFPAYVALLQEDKALGHEHRSGWNQVVTSDAS